jgi:WD40 repeat protein
MTTCWVLFALLFPQAREAEAPRPLILKGKTDSIYSMAFSPDSKGLAVGRAKALELWHLPSGKPRFLFDGSRYAMTQVGFFARGEMLTVVHSEIRDDAKFSVVRRCDVASGRETDLFGLTGGGANLALSKDARYLLTVHDLPGKIAKVWDLEQRKEALSLEGDEQHVRCAAFSLDDKTVATGGRSGTVRLWSMLNGKPRGEFKLEQAVDVVAFSPNGKLLVAKPALVDVFHFWDVEAGKEVGIVKTGGKLAAFSPDSKTVALGPVAGVIFPKKVKEKTIVLQSFELWSTASHKRLGKLTVEDGHFAMERIAWSPDGRTLAVGCRDGSILVWTVPKF